MTLKQCFFKKNPDKQLERLKMQDAKREHKLKEKKSSISRPVNEPEDVGERVGRTPPRAAPLSPEQAKGPQKPLPPIPAAQGSSSAGQAPLTMGAMPSRPMPMEPMPMGQMGPMPVPFRPRPMGTLPFRPKPPVLDQPGPSVLPRTSTSTPGLSPASRPGPHPMQLPTPTPAHVPRSRIKVPTTRKHNADKAPKRNRELYSSFMDLESSEDEAKCWQRSGGSKDKSKKDGKRKRGGEE